MKNLLDALTPNPQLIHGGEKVSTGVWSKEQRVVVAKQRKKWQT